MEKKENWQKNIYSSSDFWWVFGLLIGIYDVMSMIIREL